MAVLRIVAPALVLSLIGASAFALRFIDFSLASSAVWGIMALLIAVAWKVFRGVGGGRRDG